jgi:hypothetical protein
LTIDVPSALSDFYCLLPAVTSSGFCADRMTSDAAADVDGVGIIPYPYHPYPLCSSSPTAAAASVHRPLQRRDRHFGTCIESPVLTPLLGAVTASDRSEQTVFRIPNMSSSLQNDTSNDHHRAVSGCRNYPSDGESFCRLDCESIDLSDVFAAEASIGDLTGDFSSDLLSESGILMSVSEGQVRRLSDVDCSRAVSLSDFGDGPYHYGCDDADVATIHDNNLYHDIERALS